MFKHLILTAAALGGLAAALPAQAQVKCGPRDQIVDVLGKQHGESMVAGGLAGATKLLEVWTADEGATWTLLLTDANGTSCILASGQQWHERAPLMSMMGVES